MVFRKLFRPAPPDTQAEYSASKLDTSMRSEYVEQVWLQLRHFGVPHDVVTVDVQEDGTAGDGQPVFQVMLRVVGWERKACVRLLLGLPLLELHIRHALESSWLGDISHFGGLWLQPSRELDASDAALELRKLILAIEAGGREQDATADTPRTDPTVWPWART